jgi:Rieske Fe-S protein
MTPTRNPASSAPDGRLPRTQPKWRQDFPIDTAEDEFVARRDFVKFLVLTSAAFVVGQFWIGMQTLKRRGRGLPEPKALAVLADIPVGQAISFTYPGEHDQCVLIRTGDDTLLAYGQKCTHLSCAVLPDVANGSFVCPCHHGAFDMATGRPTAGPPRRPLPRITLELRDGLIYATGVELRT